VAPKACEDGRGCWQTTSTYVTAVCFFTAGRASRGPGALCCEYTALGSLPRYYAARATIKRVWGRRGKGVYNDSLERVLAAVACD